MELETGTIFLAGLATFASPCVLPMIPIYLSVLMGGTLQGEEEISGRARMRLLVNGASFVAGFIVVFILLGLTATALGKFLLTNRLLFQQIGGLLVFMFGLKFLGWLHIAALDREKRFHLGKSSGGGLGPIGAFFMGLTFAFGWTPCIGPILGAILTFTAVNATSLGDGVWNLFMYGAGIGLPLLVVALLAQRGVGLLNKVKRYLPRIEKGTGVVLVAMGVLMVTDSTSILTFGVGDDASASLSIELAEDAGVGQGDPAGPRLASNDGVTAHGDDAAAATACSEDTGEVCDIAPATAEELAAHGAPAASTSGSPRALYFHQPKCPNCHKVAPIIAAMTHTCSGKGLDVEKIDVSRGPNKAIAAERGVRGTPTLVFIDGDGSEVSRLIGSVDFDQVHDAVAVLMGEQCAEFTPL